MFKSLSDTTTLNNGVEMPWFGLGVYKSKEGKEVEQAVTTAIELGYRSIDTASFYQNEAGVGRAIKATGIKREDIFVTTKVWNDQQGYDSTLKAFEESRKKLNLDYVDLYLIHWPAPKKHHDTWRALEKLYHDGLVRAIGVSNFYIPELKDLLSQHDIVPAVNQVEFHPQKTSKALLEYCKQENIQMEAWSPLARGKVLTDDVICGIAAKYGKTPAQVVLRWDLQHGVVTIPKSVRYERIKQNAEVFDFELTQEEMDSIDSLNLE